MDWKCGLDGGNKNWILPHFKLLQCYECCILSFWWLSGVWILCADVSEHSVGSVLMGGVSRENSCSHHPWRWNSVSRNVGTYNSDAGEWPKRNNTTKLNSLDLPNKLLVTLTLLVFTIPIIHRSTSHYTTQPMQSIQHYQIDHVPTKCLPNIVVVHIGLL